MALQSSGLDIIDSDFEYHPNLALPVVSPQVSSTPPTSSIYEILDRTPVGQGIPIYTLHNVSAPPDETLRVSLYDVLDYVAPLALERYENNMFKHPELEKKSEPVVVKTRLPLGRPPKKKRIKNHVATYVPVHNGRKDPEERLRAQRASTTTSARSSTTSRVSALRQNSSTGTDTQEDELAFGTSRTNPSARDVRKHIPPLKPHAAQPAARNTTQTPHAPPPSSTPSRPPISKRQYSATTTTSTSTSPPPPLPSSSARKRKHAATTEVPPPPRRSSLIAAALRPRSSVSSTTSTPTSTASSIQLLLPPEEPEAAPAAASGEGGEDDEEEYEIDAILADALVDGIPFFQVKWAGWPESEASWLPEAELRGAEELLDEYRAGGTWVSQGSGGGGGGRGG